MKLSFKVAALALAAFLNFGALAAEIKARPSCCAEKVQASTPLADKSLYQIDSTWTTDEGRTLKLAALAGKPVVLTMFFASCEYACPILANDMRKIENALPSEIRTKVTFVLVSFDSDRDTPAALKKYRSTRDIPSSWTLLTAKPDDIMELAALLGVKYKKDTRGQFAHSNVISILNPAGEIVRQQTGLNIDPADSTALLSKMLAHASVAR